MSSQAGIFYFDGRPVTDDEDRALLAALSRNDTDDRGTHREAGLLLAHAAAWIDKIAELERQPIRSPAGDVLTFDGRLDNREDLLLQLRHSLQTPPTDAALALAAFTAWGKEGLVRLIGDWSLVVWRPATRTLLLASDFASVRPLYYHANRERVIWSSYLKPLVALAGEPPIDDLFVAGFLTGAKAPGHTPYRGIFPVPPGHSVCCAGEQVASHAFWQLPVRDEIRYADERDYDAHLRMLFRDAVKSRLRTSYPVCSELSGGLDSSSIVCIATSLLAHGEAMAKRLVTINYGRAGTPDDPFHQLVRRFCNAESVSVDTNDFTFLDREFLDEAAPAFWGALFTELARIARELDARTYLTGMGGDLIMGQLINDCEQLAGPLRRLQLRRFLGEALAWSRASQHSFWSVLRRGLLALMPPRVIPALRYDALASGRSALPSRYGDSFAPRFKDLTGIADPDWIFQRRWHAAPPERRKFARSVSRVLETGDLFRPHERLQHLYHTHPFGHRPLVEFMLAVPPSVILSPGEPRKLMRRAFAGLLPPEIAARRSKGSYTGVFLETVRPAARALLAEGAPLRVVELGYVEPRELRERLDRMTHALDCNEPQLRHIILLELWLRGRERRALRSAQPVLHAPAANDLVVAVPNEAPSSPERRYPPETRTSEPKFIGEASRLRS